MSQRWTKMIASPSSPYVPFHHALPRKLLKASYWIALLLVTLITFNLSGCSGSDPNLQNLTIGVMISTTGPKRLGQEAIAAINLSLQVRSPSWSGFVLCLVYGLCFVSSMVCALSLVRVCALSRLWFVLCPWLGSVLCLVYGLCFVLG